VTTDTLAVPPDGFWSNAQKGDVWDRGRSYSLSEVRHRGDALVAAASLPVRSLAFLFVDNSVDSISAYLGFLRAGHVVFLGDARLSARYKNGLVERYRPGVVWSAGEGWTPRGEFARAGGGAADLFVAKDGMPPVLHPGLALLLSTSGTTGSPKLVRLAYSALQSNAAAICQALQIDDRECAITSLNMSSAYGLSIINSHLCAGASLVCTNHGVKDSEFWEAVSAHKCTSFAGVPFQYDLLREMDYWAHPQPSIRTYTQAGGSLSPEAQRFHIERATSSGARLVVMYGQTEATARISIVPPDRLADRLGTIGEPIGGGHLSIVDPDPASGQGELLYQGPNVMLGYADGRDCLSLGDVCGGRLRTGDIATMDSDGRFRIVGRSKRIVKPFGLRISLDHLEQIISNDMALQTAIVGNDALIRVFVLRGSVERGDLTFRQHATSAHLFPRRGDRRLPGDTVGEARLRASPPDRGTGRR
jgi:long-chain acyl-CoA synthetase